MRKWPVVVISLSLLVVWCYGANISSSSYDSASTENLALRELNRRVQQYSFFTPLLASAYIGGLRALTDDYDNRVCIQYDSRWGCITVLQSGKQLHRFYGISRADIHYVAAQNGDLDDLANLGW